MTGDQIAATNSATVLRQVLRRLRDTFEAGAAERRFRALEAEARQLLHEIDQTLETLAIRAATNAKRRARATRQDLQEEITGIRQPPEEPTAIASGGDLAARKAAARARLQARRAGVLTPPPATNEPSE